MRPYLAALLLSSCAMLAPAPSGEQSASQAFPAVDPDAGPEAEPEAISGTQAGRKPKSRLPSGPAPAVSSCANLDAGDLKETIKAKLDCIKENAK